MGKASTDGDALCCFDKELEFRVEVVFYNAMEYLRPLSN
jgi:hypothetical protein